MPGSPVPQTNTKLTDNPDNLVYTFDEKYNKQKPDPVNRNYGKHPFIHFQPPGRREDEIPELFPVTLLGFSMVVSIKMT